MINNLKNNLSQIDALSFDNIAGVSVELEPLPTAGDDIISHDKISLINYYGGRPAASPAETSLPEAVGADPASPYRGLYPFGPDDAGLYFGQKGFIQKLVDLVQKQAFIAISGAPGSGKSSTVLAGLTPRLAKEGCWRFTYFRPGAGDDPFHALATALVPLYMPQLNEAEQPEQARQLAGFLRDKTTSLREVLARIQVNYPQERVLLIADQFEELYTLCPDEAVRHQFLDSLIQSIWPASLEGAAQQAVSPSLVLVLTMRADFAGQVFSQGSFMDILQENELKLGPMSREELAEAIVRPAEKMGITFEPGLVERILDDVENQPGRLPLLQFTLDLLWKERAASFLTHSTYTAIGRVSGALNGYAERVFASLEETEQAQARHVFLRLICPGADMNDTRCLAHKVEIGVNHWPLMQRLADAHLVVIHQNPTQEETIELVHERLIRGWGRLQKWVEEDRAFLTWQNGLRFSFIQWLGNKRHDRFLLQEPSLSEAITWLATRGNDLEPAVQDFIQASISLRQVEQQQDEQVRRDDLVLKITGKRVDGQDLHGEQLSGAELRGAYLRRANLRGANLKGANLSRAELKGANLGGADLSEANLSEANLNKANLAGADLRGTNLSGANLNAADLQKARIDHTTQIDGKWQLIWEVMIKKEAGKNLIEADLRGIDLNEVDLRKANLNRANLSKANLSETNLSEANLSESDLSEANFSGANLGGANLSKAQLSSAYLFRSDLRRADLRGADLSRANLSRANLRGADLRGANLSEARLKETKIDHTTQIADKWRLVWEITTQGASGKNLRRTDLSRANLGSANLNNATLSEADLSGANLCGANLSDANLSGATLQGANLGSAYLFRADLRGADLRGADLSRASLSRALYNEATQWPTWFNLEAVDVVKADIDLSEVTV